MTNTTLSLLDQAELLQLALNAGASNDSGTAIAYLKEASSRPDATATAHYLLGAEYAQIKMYERAAGAMEAALALDPSLSTARLQLGLLWLTGGAAAQALTVLGPLAELGPQEPLRLFGQGLTHLAQDQLAESRAALAAGIALNSVNLALNGDMQAIIDELDAVAAANAALPQAQAEVGVQPGAGQPETLAQEEGRHVLLSAYTGNNSGNTGDKPGR